MYNLIITNHEKGTIKILGRYKSKIHAQCELERLNDGAIRAGLPLEFTIKSDAKVKKDGNLF